MKRSLAIGLSIVLRAGLLLALASIVYDAAPKQETTVFFQIIFLQSIVVAFLSAAGFFRAQTLRTDDSAADYLAAMLVLIPLSLLLPLGLAFLDGDYTSRVGALLAIWGGAIATALAAPLSGLVLQRRGPIAAFAPASGSSLLFTAVLAAWYFGGGAWWTLFPYLIIAGFQVVTFLCLALQHRHIICAALARLRPGRMALIWTYLRENLGIGSANITHMLILLGLRELWADESPPELAAAVFLALRFSETGFQLVHMVLFGRNLPLRLIELKAALWLQAGMFLAAGALISVLYQNRAGLSLLLVAFLAQITADLARLPWSSGFLWQMAKFRLSRYLTFTLVPPIVAAALCWIPLHGGRPDVMLYLMLLVTWSGAAISSLQSRFSGATNKALS